MSKRLLVCEDEASIREFVVINLHRAGYDVTEAASGEEALSLFDATPQAFDIALLDVMLPGMDGFAVCRELRERAPSLGIIMLTARSQEAEKVGGLMMGADDYITKPFSPSELVARINALNRRQDIAQQAHGTVAEAVPAAPQAQYLLDSHGGIFQLDLRARGLRKHGHAMELTQVEFQIMEFFFANEGKALPRTDILTRVWGDEYFGEEKIVDVNIRRLRMKIEEDAGNPKHLVTVWGMGYKFNG